MLVLVWIFLFYPSWLAKDRSMSRYPQWAHYTSHAGEFSEERKRGHRTISFLRSDPAVAIWKYFNEELIFIIEIDFDLRYHPLV